MCNEIISVKTCKKNPYKTGFAFEVEMKERIYPLVAGTPNEVQMWVIALNALMQNKLEDLRQINTYESIPLPDPPKAHRKLEQKISSSLMSKPIVTGQFSQMKV